MAAESEDTPSQRSFGGPQAEKEAHFERLFQRYYRPVSYFFTNRGFSIEECRDLTQETFIGVYKGMDRFRAESSVETWLFRIAANIWRNALRSRSAEKRDGTEISLATWDDSGREISVSEVDDSPVRGPLDEALAGERLRLLREAIEELPAQMRRCLLLRIDRDMKYREIAALMQISVDTVKSQLFQAKERLKQRLAHQFDDIDF